MDTFKKELKRAKKGLKKSDLVDLLESFVFHPYFKDENFTGDKEYLKNLGCNLKDNSVLLTIAAFAERQKAEQTSGFEE